jgi:hypothetical protein
MERQSAILVIGEQNAGSIENRDLDAELQFHTPNLNERTSKRETKMFIHLRTKLRTIVSVSSIIRDFRISE